MNFEIKKDLTSNWFKTLQDAFCDNICKLEKNQTQFRSTKWKRNKKKDEGGGEYRILQNGKIFDKVGVNKSTVSGIFPKQFKSKILGAEKKGEYWASGISVVAHMKNPKIPAIHFNTRFIVTSKFWFGGGDPTLRPDLIRIVKAARKLGYEEVKLQTNGMLLGSPANAEKLKKAGVDLPRIGKPARGRIG